MKTLFGAILAIASTAHATVTIDYVRVGDAGNSNDPTTGYGAVAYIYYISKYEVTNAQYSEFLNAKAASDPIGLYSTSMGSDARGGITRTGNSGSYTYSVKSDMADKPVNYVSHLDAQRFANWMHNGQGNGDTETGAYTVGNLAVHSALAKVWIPTENEWYKAAYYQPVGTGGDTDSYWHFPTRSNDQPFAATATASGVISNPGFNVVNYGEAADWNGQNGNVTTVGSAGAASASYYGTFDQGGNVWELNEAIFFSSDRGIRGGYYGFNGGYLQATTRSQTGPTNENNLVGFRLSSSVPEIAVEQPAGNNLTDGTSSIDFATVNVGSSSAAKTFTIKNTGTATLDITGVNVTGGNTGDFLVNTGGMVNGVPIGQSTTFSVTFAPTARGSRSTTLQILNNDSDESVFDIGLTGVAVAPEIEVRQPTFANIADGGIKDFGAVAVNDNKSLVFTIKNTGDADLTGLGITIDGTDSVMFSVTALPVAPVTGPSGSTTFTVQFAPTTPGPKTAALHIANNDTDESPFDIALLGNASAQEVWRQTYFGSIQNSGDGADLNDYDRDGLVNLIEFAFGLNPKTNSAGLLPQGQIIGPNYVIFFSQPSGVSGITYGAEWSTTLQPLSWAPISDTGTPPQHTFSVPIGSNTHLFVRLKVTSP